MTLKTPLILAMTGALALSACVSPSTPTADPDARAKSGAITGAIIGGLLGASQDDDKLGKAVVGAAVGAAIGGAIGATLDQQARELQGSVSSNVRVTNMGDYLLVNMPQDLLFATDSASVRPDLAPDVKAVAMSLIRYPNSRIEVIGHTDNTGSAAYNQDLSQRRAVAVANILRESGVPNARMTAYGRGEDAPIASNLSPEGRAQNRRVEIIIRPTV